MLQATLESTHDGILVLSVDRRVIRFNPDSGHRAVMSVLRAAGDR